MKVIIVEGLDNTGKSTDIKFLQDYLSNNGLHCAIIHCNKPPKEVIDLDSYMHNEYMQLVDTIISYSNENIYDTVIIDRCWYSEYVYGHIYRGRTFDKLSKTVIEAENRLLETIGYDNVTLFLLNVDNPAFSVKHEDGLSLSDADITKIEEEQKLFSDVFVLSKLKKHEVIVNNDLEFKEKNVIFNEILSVI
jgi:thymidylate kinase